MKKLTLLAVLFCAFALSSCIETLEEVYLNKDGSGKYSLTFDMSEVFSNPMMKSMIEEAAKEEGGEDMGMDLGETDTLIMMGNGSGGIFDKTVMHMLMSDSTGQFKINMTFPFDDVSEIDQFYEEFAEEGAGAEANPLGGGGGFFIQGGGFELAKRKLIRKPADAENSANDELFAGEDGEFMKMFFASSAYTSVYHLPGSIKSTNIEGAQVEGNTVTVERNFIDLLEGKVGLDGEISYKRK
jgi:hypothetical protein